MKPHIKKVLILGSSCFSAKILINELLKMGFEVIGLSRSGYELNNSKYTNIKSDFLNFDINQIYRVNLVINFIWNRKSNDFNIKIKDKILLIKNKISLRTIFISTILSHNKIMSRYAIEKREMGKYFDQILYLSTLSLNNPVTAEKELLNIIFKFYPIRFFFILGRVELKFVTKDLYLKKMSELILDKEIKSSSAVDRIIEFNAYCKEKIFKDRFFIPIPIPITLIKIILEFLKIYKLKNSQIQKIINLIYN